MYKGIVTDVFFDLDHTLWDFDKNSGLTFQKILSDHAIAVDHDDFINAYMPINLEYWKHYRDNKISKSELRYQRLKKTFETIRHPVRDETIHRLAADYITHLSSFSNLMPHTEEVLRYLRPSYRLHIITNGFQEVQWKKLRNANIHGYFNEIINSEMAGVKKPHPYIFKLALKRAGTTARKSLMIGDNIEADILGAQAVGLNTLHFNGKNEPEHEYCHTIRELHEIKSYL